MLYSYCKNTYTHDPCLTRQLYFYLFFLYPSRLLFQFIFFLSFCITRAYLCLAEVKWVKTGVPGIFESTAQFKVRRSSDNFIYDKGPSCIFRPAFGCRVVVCDLQCIPLSLPSSSHQKINCFALKSTKTCIFRRVYEMSNTNFTSA